MSVRADTASARIAGLIGLEAISLAVMSSLHLAGVIAGGRKPFDPTNAGIAEAVICVALSAGAITLVRAPERGRIAALAALMFAVLGFIVGITVTAQGGDAVDIAYHSTVLPLLLLTLALLVTARPSGRRL